MNLAILPVVFTAWLDSWTASALTLAGFVVLLFLLFGVLRHGKPRQTPSMMFSDPPVQDPTNPDFQRRRAQAAAAALILHRKRHANGELDEDR